jgi:hypothetical protein
MTSLEATYAMSSERAIHQGTTAGALAAPSKEIALF